MNIFIHPYYYLNFLRSKTKAFAPPPVQEDGDFGNLYEGEEKQDDEGGVEVEPPKIKVPIDIQF